MKQTSILMTSDNSLRIIDGRKTHTRRAVLKQPESWEDPKPCCITTSEGFQGPIDRSLWSAEGTDTEDEEPRRCPYGGPGDILVIRERHWRFGHWERVPGMQTKTGRGKWQFIADTDTVLFDPPGYFRVSPPAVDVAHIPEFYRRQAMHMPWEFSRARCQIIDTRPERLQSITDADSLAEGITGTYSYPGFAIGRFRHLWISINGAESWDANAWVWVIIFRLLGRAV